MDYKGYEELVYRGKRFRNKKNGLSGDILWIRVEKNHTCSEFHIK